MFEKLIGFARKGNGRRLLNTLNKGSHGLTEAMLDDVLKTYCDTGLNKEVDVLKKRRGFLSHDQYNALAEAVRQNCCYEKFADFESSLRTLLTSGIKMNPAKMDMDDPD